MVAHPDKCKHHFDSKKGRPAYWLRNDVKDLVEHARMVREHERVHRRKP